MRAAIWYFMSFMSNKSYAWLWWKSKPSRTPSVISTQTIIRSSMVLTFNWFHFVWPSYWHWWDEIHPFEIDVSGFSEKSSLQKLKTIPQNIHLKWPQETLKRNKSCSRGISPHTLNEQIVRNWCADIRKSIHSVDVNMDINTNTLRIS